MKQCTNCSGSGFSATRQFEPCESCNGNGDFLSQTEARFADVANWQWFRFGNDVYLKVNDNMAVNANGIQREFYSSDAVEPLLELSGIVKLVVDSYQRSK